MILLKADEGLSDPQIMAALNVSRPCVERIRKRFVADGIERALNEDPRPGQKRKLDGRAEATLIATACTEAPEGHEHWTLRLLAGKLVQLGLWTPFRTKRCVRRSKKRAEALAARDVVHSGSRWRVCGLYGRCAGSVRAAFDPQRPLVCYDEWRRALIGETRTSLPAQPGRRKRIDYEYSAAMVSLTCICCLNPWWVNVIFG